MNNVPTNAVKVKTKPMFFTFILYLLQKFLIHDHKQQ